jgi:glycosyltransferase involved in cell wall biosynthesis
MKKLKIAFIGLKGIPAKWGGIEVYVQEIASRLAHRGHDVTVYCRRWFTGNCESYAGIRIKRSPTIKSKSIDALLHGMTSSCYAAASDYDIVHYHGLASYFSAAFPTITGKKVVVTIHAASWVEPKWNRLAIQSLKTATIIGIRMAHAITTVSPVLQEFLSTIANKQVILTPPGVTVGTYKEPININREYGLGVNNYILFMGRIDTVKRVDLLIKAFKSLSFTDSLKLVIAGDTGASDGAEYKNRLIEDAGDDKRIVFTGFQSGINKEELLSNCFLFVLPSLSEGAPIALLEGMSYGRPCLASNIPAHEYIISDGMNGFLANGDLFEDFKQKLSTIVVTDRGILSKIGASALEFVGNKFSWDITTDIFEQTYYRLIS